MILPSVVPCAREDQASMAEWYLDELGRQLSQLRMESGMSPSDVESRTGINHLALVETESAMMLSLGREAVDMLLELYSPSQRIAAIIYDLYAKSQQEILERGAKP